MRSAVISRQQGVALLLVALNLASGVGAMTVGLAPAVGTASAPSLNIAGKCVYFVRHGQAEHNIMFESNRPAEGRVLLDPALSPLGRDQAAALGKDSLIKEALAQPNPLLIVSPLRRTMQTAIIGLGPWAREQGQKIVLMPDLQETGEVPCDTGSPLKVVEDMFQDDRDVLDFENVGKDWEKKVALNKDTGAALLGRLERFLVWLRPRSEQTVVIVAHHNVFLALLKVSFLNCEVRKFSLDCNAPAARLDTTPIEGGWTALEPLLSTAEEDLVGRSSEQAAAYSSHNFNKMKYWGLRAPERFR